jgi:glycerophosphoryl diester phosphodiesterase
MKPYLLAESPIPFAHRGGAGLFPENTNVAFEGALALGFRYIETDLHLTRDGAWVCFHDDSVDRVTNGSGPVSRYTRAELQALDAGYRFSPDGGGFPYRGQGARVLTLEEALALHPHLRLNLEIKPDRPELARALLEEIDRLDAYSRVLVASAHDRVTRAFRRLAAGGVATSAGVRGIIAFWLAVRSRLQRLGVFPFDALQVPLSHYGLTVVDRRFVEAAHRHGLKVHVWTVDEPEPMRYLAGLGVDGIMTDRPDILSDVLGRPSPVPSEPCRQ